MIDRCRESQGVIVVLDPAQKQRDLAAAVLRCPGCASSLRQWGFARPRSLRARSARGTDDRLACGLRFASGPPGARGIGMPVGAKCRAPPAAAAARWTGRRR